MTTSHPRRLRRTLLAVTATTVLTLSGCGEEETPPDSASPDSNTSASPSPSDDAKPSKSPDASPTKAESSATTVEVKIAGSAVTPLAKTVELAVGEPLVLKISSDRIGELHVHSTPEQEVNFDNGSVQKELSFDQPGSVDIEEHETGALVLRVLVK